MNISEIQNAINAAHAKWKAGETPYTTLPQAELLKHLGFVPGPGSKSLEERESISITNLQSATGANGAGIPASYDLRNVGGQNFITPVKDQGGCGSCVAFGTVATVEGIGRKQGLNLDLSEAQLFYCYARNEGRNCLTGWWPERALDHFKNDGVVDEGCFPYTAGDQQCSLCSDWMSRLTKIDSWQTFTSTAEMKNWISTVGPLTTCFTVYFDFFSYKSGIYSHVSGGVAGGHCVSIIGYDDAGQFWICKNSWGTQWGESGFFCIAYGQCGIDAEMWAVPHISGGAVWFPISEGSTMPGAPITAVETSANKIALFLADPNGGVYTNSGFGTDWGSWTSVSEGKSIPGGKITALDTGQNKITLFLADPNGGVYTNSGFGTDWGSWTYVPGLKTMPGAPITAVETSANKIALFLADSGGGVYGAFQ